MRVVLLNPPLIPSNSVAELRALDDEDNSLVSIGLYSLAAVLMADGFDVRLLNHAVTPWNKSLSEVAALQPDLVGLTCMTHHRAAVMAWCEAFKALQPGARIILGGVHASFLYQEILERVAAVDFVAVGEAERSLLELARRLGRGDSPHGVAGIASRHYDGSLDWPGPAAPIDDLGALPIPSEHFSYPTIATVRGCPFRCTFCCSPQMWGSRVRERPVEHVLRELELLRHRHGRTQIAFKDETFTVSKRRVEEICRGIIDAGLDLWWTCDTRVDCLDEERLYWMRKAGCFYVSFGVESGSEEMLSAINKKTSLEKIRAATDLARKFGMYVRYYLIVGLPDETPRDLDASLRLVRSTRPSFVFTAPLSLSPGTEVFSEYCRRYNTDSSFWFKTGEPLLLFDPKQKWRSVPAGRELMDFTDVGADKVKRPPINPLTEAELREAQSRLADCLAPNYELALFLKETKRLAEAIPFYERALAIRPDFGKGRLDLGVCYDSVGRLNDAVAQWERIEGIEGESPINVALSLIYRGLAAEARGGEGGLDAALALWRRAHERHPEATDPLRLIAERCARLARWEEAAWAAERWAKLDSSGSAAYHIAALCCLGQGNAADAQTLFERARSLDPENPEILHNYAVLMLQAGHPADAVNLLEACLELDPSHASARQLLAQGRERTN